ncbi:MAG TPA: hypothetical protein VM890_00995, partial [Longimicrobium sp.]|nr:hypothetical protein [Longimicrobium sp.]
DAALADRRETLRNPQARADPTPWYHYARLLRRRGDAAAAGQALDSARVRADPRLRGALTLDPLPSLQSPLIRGWAVISATEAPAASAPAAGGRARGDLPAPGGARISPARKGSD